MAGSATRRIVFGHRIALGLCALLTTSCVDPNAFKFGSGEGGPEPKSKSPQPDKKAETGSTQEDGEATTSERAGEPEGGSEGPDGTEPETETQEPEESATEETGTKESKPEEPSDAEPEEPEPEEPKEDPDKQEPDDGPESDDSGDDSGQPDDSPGDDTPERERGHKQAGQACRQGKECTSGACTPINLEWMRYEVKSRNCAECIDHQDCIDSGRGIACTPYIVTKTKVERAHYVCAKGQRGELCEGPKHCAGGLVCGSLLPEDRRLPKLPIKSCGECASDADCKDIRFPKCQMNTIVPPRLPAYNTCVRG